MARRKADRQRTTETREPVLAPAGRFLPPRPMAELRARALLAQHWPVMRQLDELIARSNSPAK